MMNTMDPSMNTFSLLYLLLVIQVCQAAVYTTVGSTAILPCSVPNVYPQWRNSTTLFNYEDNQDFGGAGEMKNRLSWNNLRNLVISNVTRTDDGQYKCTQAGTREQIVDLIVRVKPHTIEIYNATTDLSTDAIYGMEGIALNLACRSSGGYPEQTVQWYRISTPLQSYKSVTQDTVTNTFNINQFATITPQKQDDTVVYTCTSSFPDEPTAIVTKSATLYLQLRPSVPTITILGNFSEGDNKPIARCDTTGFRPRESFHLNWVFGGKTIGYTESPVENESAKTYSLSATYQDGLSREDNGKNLTCSVTHQTLTNPRTNSVIIQVAFKPQTTNITGNRAIVANGANNLTLICTSGTSLPVADIAWKINGQERNSDGILADQSGQYGGILRKRELTLRPTRHDDNAIVTCEASNVLSGGVSAKSNVQLNLIYSPMIFAMADTTVVEGNKTVLECSASSNPPSTFKWYSGNNLLSQGSGTASYNGLVYNIINVNRSNAGVYRCEANNGVENGVDQSVNLIVHYPPVVTVRATNSSVQSNFTTLICNASGIPDTGYKFEKWIQTWPGYDPVVYESSSGSQILNLTNLTYQHSGLYTCSASNSIKVFGSNKEYMSGSVFLLVKSFPIIAGSNKTPTEPQPIPGVLKHFASTNLEYYSNTESPAEVFCYKNLNGSRQTKNVCSTNHTKAIISLEVFSHLVPAAGVRTTIYIKIDSENDFGFYDAIIKNEVGETTLSLKVFPQGPPNSPYSIRLEDVQQISSILTWLPGFNGGLQQTFVIQLSSNNETWSNHTTVVQEEVNNERTSATLTGLTHSRTYFVRMFAYNNEGSSNFTDIYTFTTSTSKKDDDSTPVALIGGAAGGSAALIVILVIVGVVLLRRNGCLKKGKSKSNDKNERTKVVKEEDDYGMQDNPMYVSADPKKSGDVADNAVPFYAEVRKKKEPEPVNNVYAQVDKTSKVHLKKGKQDKKNNTRQTEMKNTNRPIEGDVYENASSVVSGQDQSRVSNKETIYENPEQSKVSTKKNSNKDGLIYADLAFNDKPKGQKKLVIHGLDSMTEYVQVDFNKKADPLPDSDDEKGDGK